MHTAGRSTGFQRCSTDILPWQTKVENFLREKADHEVTLEYFKMACGQGPYDYFATLTFREGTGKTLMIMSTNTLLHQMNQKIYGRNYKKKNISISGFAILEKHKSQMLDEREHIHLLIKSNKKFSLEDHRDIFSEVIRKIVNSKDRQIFKVKTTDIQKYRNKGAITYAMKDVYDSNIEKNFKMITLEGISDYI